MFYSASGVGTGAGGGAIWPKLVGVSAFADANTTSATPTISSPAAGYVIIAWCFLAGGGDGVFAAAPAGEGWTRITDVEDTAGNNMAVSAFVKYWGSGATDDTTPTFTAAAGSLGVVVETWQNCREAAVVHTSSTAHGAGGTTVSPADATSTAAERISVTCAVGGLTSAGNIATMNAAFYTQTFAGGSYATTAGPDRGCAGARNENIAVAGAVDSDSVVATFTVANSAWAAITVVLRGP